MPVCLAAVSAGARHYSDALARLRELAHPSDSSLNKYRSSQSSSLDRDPERWGWWVCRSGDDGMASRRSKTRHFSIPAEHLPSKPQYECQQKIWTSDVGNGHRQRSSSQSRYIDVVATPSELQGLLPPQNDEQGSEDYRRQRGRTWRSSDATCQPSRQSFSEPDRKEYGAENSHAV